MEIHHHDVDGKGEPFMDWPVTPGYVRAMGKALGIPVYESWRHGGFRRHMLRSNEPPAPVSWESIDGQEFTKDPAWRKRSKDCGVCGELCYGCIGKFPQVSADLMIRWCSSALKIEIMERMLSNDPRFRNIRILVITGERAQESAARAKYKTFEPHRADLRDGKKYKRHIDHWRPIHAWTEEQVWETMERYKVRPHPAYRLGWGRLSCMSCIFGSPSQWASVKAIAPERFDEIADYEEEFQCSIHRTQYLRERIQNAKPYEDMDPKVIAAALSTTYDEPIFETGKWVLPSGAFGEQAGPT